MSNRVAAVLIDGQPQGLPGGDVLVDVNGNALVTDAKVTFTDVTTGNASTSAHGYLKKLDNDATHFMNGAGNWIAPTVLDLGAYPTSNGAYSGKIGTVTVDTNSVGVGCILAMAADFHYDEADADAIANCIGMCMALETSTGTKKVLYEGLICNTAWNWSNGFIYLSTTLGTLTQTAPTGADDAVIPLGWAVSATAMYFNPYLATMEHLGS